MPSTKKASAKKKSKEGDAEDLRSLTQYIIQHRPLIRELLEADQRHTVTDSPQYRHIPRTLLGRRDAPIIQTRPSSNMKPVCLLRWR